MPMATPYMNTEGEAPDVIITSSTIEPKPRSRNLFKLNSKDSGENKSASGLSHRIKTISGRERHVRVQNGPSDSTSSNVYMGSYKHSPRHSRTSFAGPSKTPEGSMAPSPRASVSQIHIEQLYKNQDFELETYGVEEYRDGFFDGLFLKPPQSDQEELMKMAEYTLPAAFKKRHPLSPSQFLPKQWHEVKGACYRITRTRAGIQLTRSFLAFFIAYVLCLVSVTGGWLGKYREIVILSVLINHPGRTVGAQIDGTILTIIGTASGLGWGALALYLSASSPVAANGYGGILATFLLVFMGIAAALRSYFIRLYQLVISAGISIIYTCLADTSRTVAWSKLLSYGIPWVIGQAICLIVCCTIFPDAGARPIAVALHDAFASMQDGLTFPRKNVVALHRELAWTFVSLSQAYRDLAIDISVTRFNPDDVASLRNIMQSVLRAMLALKTKTNLFDDLETSNPSENEQSMEDTAVIGENLAAKSAELKNIHEPELAPERNLEDERAARVFATKMGDPVRELLLHMRVAISSCDAVLLDMSGYRKYLGPPEAVSSDIVGALTNIRKAILNFDEKDRLLMQDHQLPTTYSGYPELVKLSLFTNPVRQAANCIEDLLALVMKMQQQNRGWRFYLPSLWSLQRTNAQVRHDRGGVTAGFFFHSQEQLNRLMQDSQKNTYQPLPQETDKADGTSNMEDLNEEEKAALDRDTANNKSFRYLLWLGLHRLQGFETRFALKVAIVISLLSVPAWLEQSAGWYNRYQSWWAVVMAWLMMHPRVGGNFQDLVTRSLCGVIGAAWGGFSYAAGNGNPYVMAVFAVIYMVPMLYRFTRSSHPRSGLVGCVSFPVVSLNAYAMQGNLPVVTLSWSLGLAIVVGVISAIVVNWILWPFVARHELRKSISTMLFHSAIIYRGVVSKYIYYEDGQAPKKEDIARSEEIEGQLREGFVRIRQLMALTRHEIRLRGPFNPLPYSALIEDCESFFEHLIEVRQASLFFHPNYMSDSVSASEALLPYRRDAVAAILFNLYILSGALRGSRKVPRYLPDAAAARKKLLDRMAEVEMEYAQARTLTSIIPKEGVGRRFAEVYQFAYSQNLSACVVQLENMQRYTKAICGEEGFDLIDEDDEDEIKLTTSRGLD